MAKLQVVTIFLYFTWLKVTIGTDLPDYIPRCYFDKDKLNKCLLQADEISEASTKRIKFNTSFLVLDPFNLGTFDIGINVSNNEFKTHASDINVFGLSKCTFQKFNYHPESLRIDGVVSCDVLLLKGGMQSTGVLVFVPVHGNGKAKYYNGPSNTTFSIEGILVDRKGEQYYLPTKTSVSMQLKDMKCYLKGSFDNYDGQLTTNLINSFSKDLAPYTSLLMEVLIEEAVMKYFPKYTATIPFRELLQQMSVQLSNVNHS